MTLKSIYNSYHGPKCSYHRFWVRINKKGWQPDQAIKLPLKYWLSKEFKIAKLEKEISDLIEKRSKYESKSDEYRDIQDRKNKLVRSLSVYKSR